MTINEILEAARRLPQEDRRRLLSALQHGESAEPTEGQQRDSLLTWIGLAGAFHSVFTDVSSDKYRHLADVYGDRR